MRAAPMFALAAVVGFIGGFLPGYLESSRSVVSAHVERCGADGECNRFAVESWDGPDAMAECVAYGRNSRERISCIPE